MAQHGKLKKKSKIKLTISVMLQLIKFLYGDLYRLCTDTAIPSYREG